MRNTLLAAGALAALLGTAAFAWSDGPHRADQPWPAATATAGRDAGPISTSTERPGPRPGQHRGSPEERRRHGGHGDGVLENLLGSVFFFGLFSH